MASVNIQYKGKCKTTCTSQMELLEDLKIGFYRPQTKFAKVVFTRVCNSVHGGGMRGCSGRGMHGCSGGCVWLLGGVHAWLLWGGMHGCSRGAACMVALGGGYAWLLWGGGMCGCLGVCMVAPGGVACVVAPRGHMVAPGGTCMGYDEIQRYDQ